MEDYYNNLNHINSLAQTFYHCYPSIRGYSNKVTKSFEFIQRDFLIFLLMS